MPEDARSKAESAPEVSLWSETTNPQRPAAALQTTSDEGVFGIQEKAEGDLLLELEKLDSKIEALVSRCEELARLNDTLTAQLAKERETKARRSLMSNRMPRSAWTS